MGYYILGVVVGVILGVAFNRLLLQRYRVGVNIGGLNEFFYN